MKQIALSFLFIVAFTTASFAKDTDAWKKDSTLEQQYITFKKNLNFWNSSYFLSSKQMDDFYKSMSDTINKQKTLIGEKQAKIGELNAEIATWEKKNAEVEAKLNKSLKNQDSISLFGMNIDKNLYSIVLYLIIAGVLFLAGFVFLLYKRSLVASRKLKNDYEELKEEYEVHKKNALERYTQINMELHHTRLELQNKK